MVSRPALAGPILFALALSSALASSLEDRGLATITTPELREHVEILASDGFEGRKPSTPGEDKTVQYLVEHFREIGLKPIGEGGYLQSVRLLSQRTKASSRVEILGPKRERLRWEVGEDILLHLVTDDDACSLKRRRLIFVGYGIVAPERGWDDYGDVDVRGAVVLALKGEPTDPGNPGLFDGPVPTYYSTLDSKKAEAGRRGAAGIVFVHQEAVAGFPWRLVGAKALEERWSVPLGSTADTAVQLSAAVSEEAARRALGLAGHDLAQLIASASRPAFTAVPLDLGFQARIEVSRAESPSSNVIGMVTGSERPEEHLVYTAHWDHVGIGKPVDGDRIYNGAVDNATGTAALLEIAEAFTSLPRAPKRSVVFLATTAEEMGLLGSHFYVRHPALPLADAVGVINMDALFPFGAQNGMTVTGAGQSELEVYLERAVRADGRQVQADPNPEAGAYFRSDHHPFAQAGVPGLFAVGGPLPEPAPSEALVARYSDFMTRRYHAPDDELEADWDFDGILGDTRVFFRTGLAIAEDDRIPNWSFGSEFRARGDELRR